MSRTSRIISTLITALIVLSIIGCAAAPTPTTAPTSPPPAAQPTTTPPTNTPLPPPTNTAVPPTATAIPPTPTRLPATATPALAADSCAGAANTLALLQTPTPSTPAPAAATLAPTIAPTTAAAATIAPTPTPRPAPSTDRVGYPDDYQSKYKLLYILDRGGNEQVRVICGNEAAASVKQGQPFPYGSIIVMETWRAKRDGGSVARDPNGHFIREALTGIFVMRKEKDFGADYKEFRSGEWEYVAFRPGPDKQYATPPQGTTACAACHLAGSSRADDFTFRTPLFFQTSKYTKVEAPKAGEVVVSSMAYAPVIITVKPGATVKWILDDTVEHTVTASDKLFDSGAKNKTEFSFKFEKAGIYNYVCTLHPDQMRGRVEVKE